MYAKIKTMLINVEIKPFLKFIKKVVSFLYCTDYNHSITNDNEVTELHLIKV